jgi:hypothetical protein
MWGWAGEVQKNGLRAASASTGRELNCAIGDLLTRTGRITLASSFGSTWGCNHKTGETRCLVAAFAEVVRDVTGVTHGPSQARVPWQLLADVEPRAASLNHHSARQADRRTEPAHAIGTSKSDSIVHKAVQVRRSDIRITQSGNGILPLIVRQDEENVGATGRAQNERAARYISNPRLETTGSSSNRVAKVATLVAPRKRNALLISAIEPANRQTSAGPPQVGCGTPQPYRLNLQHSSVIAYQAAPSPPESLQLGRSSAACREKRR